jgi:hypothetical protein
MPLLRIAILESAMNNESLLKALLDAKGDPQKLALATIDAFFSAGGDDMRRAIEAAAMPHWFNSTILEELLDEELKPRVQTLLGEISGLPFCEPFEQRQGFNVNKVSRSAIRNRLFIEHRGRFVALTKHAIDVFNGDSISDRLERAFHMLWAAPECASQFLPELVAELQEKPDALVLMATLFRECMSEDETIPAAIGAWGFWIQSVAQSQYLSDDERFSLADKGYQLAVAANDLCAISALAELGGDIRKDMGEGKMASELYRESIAALEKYAEREVIDVWISESLLNRRRKLASLDLELPENLNINSQTTPMIDSAAEIGAQMKSPQIGVDAGRRVAIFVSAVSSEFESEFATFPGLRSGLRRYLARAGCHVFVQEDFRQTALDTLQKQDSYICKSAAVIHLVGEQPGVQANPHAVRQYLASSPNFLSAFPELRESLGDCFHLTYTQWEALIALHHRIALFVYATPLATNGQTEHLKRLRIARRHPETFASVDQLFGKLIGDLRDIIPALPIQDEMNDLVISVSKLNKRFQSITNIELINDQSMPRKEASHVFDAVVSTEGNGALLIADAGYGKSCVLAQVIELLQFRKMPFVAFKLDSLSECSSSERLGKELGLPESPVKVLSKISQGKPCVLVVDQLDSISLVSGRKTNTWIAFDELRREVLACPGMKLVVACRSFDLNQDYRLRPLGAETSGFQKVTVTRLSNDELRAALNQAKLDHFIPTPQQIEILNLPFHLTLFLQGEPEKPFSRVGELYDRYWQRKREKLRESLGRTGFWSEVIDTLTEWMSSHQRLDSPKDIVDKWEEDARHMASLHVLVDHGKTYQFFHESFFDYAFARRFCLTGQSLCNFLTQPGEEQHLFRRGQVRQILGYRRENRQEEYLGDLKDLLASHDVRFHIRRMVASELYRVPDPIEAEWRIVEPFVLNGDLSRAVSNALRGHVGWFDVLNRLGVWKRWMASEDQLLVNAAIWFLEAHDLHKSRSEAIAALLEPYATMSGDWDNHLKRVLSWGVAHHSTRMAELYFTLIRRGIYDDEKRRDSGGDFWSNHYNAEKENPRFIIDLLACWLRHTIAKCDDGKRWNFIDQAALNHSHSGSTLIGKVGEHEPEYFIAAILPIVVETVERTAVQSDDRLLNRAWPYLNNAGDPFDINDAVLICLRRAMQRIAKNDVAQFRVIVEPLKSQHHETFCYLLLSAYAENPAAFANESIVYMLDHKPRLNIGYGSWSGGEGHGESAISRTLIRAASPICDEPILRRLEDEIIGYCDAFERRTPGHRGFAELLLLRSIDVGRRLSRANIRISELECSFPRVGDEIPEADESMGASWVGSPIEEPKAVLMSDAQWLSVMRKYDGSTDRFRGGPVELSRMLTDLTRKDRIRFSNLVLSMPEDLDTMYFAAVLDGMSGHGGNLPADQREVERELMAQVPTELFVEVIQRLHGLPGRTCGTSICHAIQRLAERVLPDEIFDILAYYAIEDPDPFEDPEPDEGRNAFSGDPYFHGINSVRGQAAEAIASLLHGDKERLPKLLPTLKLLIRDSVMAVRCCSVNALTAILNFDRPLAVELFLNCTQDAIPLWSTAPFDRFLLYGLHSHYQQLKDLLQATLRSANEKIVEIGVSKIALAVLGGKAPAEDILPINSGSDQMRKAACHVYARNLDCSNKGVAEKAAAYLPRYFNDECEDVRKQVANAFWDISGERLLELESLVLTFIESRSFETDPEDLLRALETSQAELPHVICRAAERILEFVGEEGTHIAYRGSMTAHSISTLIVRQYAQTADEALKVRCLDLIDRMERIGYMGIAEELNKIDR